MQRVGPQVERTEQRSAVIVTWAVNVSLSVQLVLPVLSLTSLLVFFDDSIDIVETKDTW